MAAFDIISESWNLVETLKKSIDIDLKNKDLQALKLIDFQLFQTIYNNEPLTKVEISRKLKRSRSDITILAARLINKNLIKIVPSPTDRRKQYLHLTQRGLELVPIYLNKITEINNRISVALSEGELRIFQDTLHKILQLL